MVKKQTSIKLKERYFFHFKQCLGLLVLEEEVRFILKMYFCKFNAMSFTQSVSLQLASLLMLVPSIGVSPLRDKLLLLLLPIQLLLLLPLWTGSASAARDPFKGTSVHGEVSNAKRYHLIQCHLQNYKKHA